MKDDSKWDKIQSIHLEKVLQWSHWNIYKKSVML